MKTKTRKILIKAVIVLLCVVALTLGWIIFDATVDRSGWHEKDGRCYYRDFHGHRVTGWLDTNDGRYYLDGDGWKRHGPDARGQRHTSAPVVSVHGGIGIQPLQLRALRRAIS